MVDDKKTVKQKLQTLTLDNREKLNLSGVIDVISFNDENIIVDTELGIIIIRGEQLRINKLSLENSELNVEGLIYSLEYNDKDGSKSRGTGFFAKMFK